MTEPFDYNKALTDVRKAWRLVAAYQQRAFFLMKELEIGFPELEFSHWQPSFYGPPVRRGGTPPWTTTRWVWDGLPLYSFDSWFTMREDASTAGGLWFMLVRVCADNAFPSTDEQIKEMSKSGFRGPDPTKMPAVKESKSEITICVYHAREGHEWNGRATSVNFKTDDADSTTPQWEESKEAGLEYIVWKEQLATLFSDDEKTGELIDRIRRELETRGFLDKSESVSVTG